MTRDVDTSYSLQLEQPLVKVTELYDVVLRDGNTYYYTSHHAAIIWGGHTYTVLPITRDPIHFGINLEMDNAMVYLAGISGDLQTYVAANNLDTCEVTIRQIQRGFSSATDHEVILFQGFADVKYNRDILILELRPWIDSLNLSVPRCTYQEPCNWMIFDEYCGLLRADLSFTGTVSSGTKVQLTGPMPPAASFSNRHNWVGGELWMRSGDDTGQRRPIRQINSLYLDVMWPFPEDLSFGNDYTLYPGCDGMVSTCLSYGNTDQLRSYLYVPRIEETFP